MKKIISLIVSIVMIASVFALAVPASAANVDPAFPADKSKIIAVSFPKAAANVNPDALIDGSYAGDNLNPCEGIEAYGNGTTARLLGGAAFYQANTPYTAYSEKLLDDGTDIYNVFCALTLGEGNIPAKTKISSICISIPAEESKVGGSIPDGFSLYAGQAVWFNTADNEEAKININKVNYKYVCTCDGLYSQNKYSVSADGSFRYYQCNLPEPVECTYLLLVFSHEFDLYLTQQNRDEGKENAPTVYHYVLEFAAFSEEMPLADTAGTTEHRHVSEEETDEESTPAEETTAGTPEETTAETPEETTAEEAEDTTAETPVETTGEKVEDTTAAPVETTAEPPKNEKGCSSSASVFAAVAIIGSAVLFARKKH